MFCIMDLLLNGIKRNTEVHAPQTHTSQTGNRLLAHGGHESYTCQSLPQPAGKDEDDMSSVSLAPPAKLWTRSCTPMATCWWAPVAVSRSDLASELQTCLSNFLMDISTYFSKNSAFLKLTSRTILFLHLIPTFLVVGIQFSSVQSLSCVWLFAAPWTAARQASLSITDSRSPPKPMSIELVMPSNHLILCRPLLLLPWIFPSIRVFSNESALHIRWPTYWSFSFNISPSNEYPGLISFRMDWLNLLAVQGTLKSLLQHLNSKASIFWHSAFFTVQLAHLYMTTGKTIALTRRTFVGKVTSLLFKYTV